MKKLIAFVLAMILMVSGFSGYLLQAEAYGETTIVALDAGHDAKHAGATAGELLEHELTLKIAYYCKAELEKYPDIEVYMTRSDSACPYPNTQNHASCIRDRMSDAEYAGADYYISFHLNAHEKSTSASGVEVYYPNSSWKPEVGSKGKILGEYIQKELVSLGLNDRGAKSKNTSISELYPDGSLADYYTVQIAGKYSGIPSVIVEHAFMTSETDRTNFLQTEEGLKKLGKADADAIAKSLGKHVGWEYTNGNWYYYSGGILQKGWTIIDGYWYALDNVTGAMKVGWHYINGEWYYMQPGSGIMQTGWIQVGDYWYYLNGAGAMQTGWIELNSTWYYLNKNGERQNGWLRYNDEWYYLDDSGAMITGWLKLGEIWYYLEQSGAMTTDWQNIDGVKYLFASSGELVEGTKSFIIDVSHWQGNIDWDEVAKTSVDGVIVRSGHGDATTEKNGEWQDKKFVENIAALNQRDIPYGIYHYNTATTIEQAKLQAQNTIAQIKNANARPTLPVYVDIEQDGGTCDLVAIAKVYLDEFVANGYKAGVYANGNYWENYLNDSSLDLYYKWIAGYGNNDGYPDTSFKPKAGMDNYGMWQYTSEYELDGITENTVDANVMFQWHDKSTGWSLVDGQWFYYENGYLVNDWKKIGTTWCYFADNGVMQTGWQLVRGVWYFMDANGAMQTGWLSINSTWYYMDASGAMQTGWELIDGIWYYMDDNGAMQTGWQLVGTKWYYMDGSGAMQTGWILIQGVWYYMDASGAWVG